MKNRYTHEQRLTDIMDTAYRQHECAVRKSGGGVSVTQKFAYQKWPDKIFPTVNSIFSHDGHFGLGGGGAQGLGGWLC